MTLETALLQKVPEWRPSPHERAGLTVAEQDGPWFARLTADRCEELGIALWELRLERMGSPLTLDADQLSAWAANIVKAPTLLEALSLVELDKARGLAQIRSDSPIERGGARLYYELLLARSGQLSLHRYQADSSGREEIPFVLTHENLGRLVAHWTGAADQVNC